jgi:hypothetical protein
MALRCAVAFPPEERRGKAELSVSSAVTELTSCVALHFNNISQFTVRPVIFARRRTHVLLNNLSFICLSYKC